MERRRGFRVMVSITILIDRDADVVCTQACSLMDALVCLPMREPQTRLAEPRARSVHAGVTIWYVCAGTTDSGARLLHLPQQHMKRVPPQPVRTHCYQQNTVAADD